ncbi:MAG: PilZ domain-containing protein, partial [Desulfurivibrionaceae bacterium]
MAANGRRKNKRVEFRTTVTASFGNAYYEKCELKDLSMGGLFVYGITDQEVGDVCDLT